MDALIILIFSYILFFSLDLIFRGNKKQNKTNTNRTDKPSTTLTIPREERERRQREKAVEIRIHNFWEQAYKYVIVFKDAYDIESLREFVYNVWTTRDKVESAKDLHSFLEHTVETVYPIRDYNGGYHDFLIEICYLDVSNYDNYKKAVGNNGVFRIPTKLAILLEKAGRFTEAISFCEYCIANNIPDHGYKSFENRKKHLEYRLH